MGHHGDNLLGIKVWRLDLTAFCFQTGRQWLTWKMCEWDLDAVLPVDQSRAHNPGISDVGGRGRPKVSQFDQSALFNIIEKVRGQHTRNTKFYLLGFLVSSETAAQRSTPSCLCFESARQKTQTFTHAQWKCLHPLLLFLKLILSAFIAAIFWSGGQTIIYALYWHQ